MKDAATKMGKPEPAAAEYGRLVEELADFTTPTDPPFTFQQYRPWHSKASGR